MQDIPDLLEGLKRAPGILAGFVKTIPEDKMHVRRGEGFWTIAEHVSHLAQVQPMLLERVQRFMRENRPEFTPYLPGSGRDEPETPALLSTTDALKQFAAYRSEQLAVLQGLDGLAWQKTATHPEYEQYSLYILTRHVLMHDHWHMYRIEELWLTRDAYLTSLG